MELLSPLLMIKIMRKNYWHEFRIIDNNVPSYCKVDDDLQHHLKLI